MDDSRWAGNRLRGSSASCLAMGWDSLGARLAQICSADDSCHCGNPNNTTKLVMSDDACNVNTMNGNKVSISPIPVDMNKLI